MEPIEPIPGKPPRRVVIDRQRKLFASLEIADLLAELVRNSNLAANLNRASTIQLQLSAKKTGCLLSTLTTQSTTAVSHLSGSVTAINPTAPSALSPAKVFISTRKMSAPGDPSLSTATMRTTSAMSATGTARLRWCVFTA